MDFWEKGYKSVEVLALKKSFLILSGFPGIYDTVLLCTNRQLPFRHYNERPLLNKVIFRIGVNDSELYI